MSKPLTLEQSLLNKSAQLLMDYSSEYDQRLLVLEACAAVFGGFDIDEYWRVFGVAVIDAESIKNVAKSLSLLLTDTGISPALALSSLSREPISISEQKKNGAYYTDFRLAEFVAEECSKSLKRDSKVADIAAGSGILLAAVADFYFKSYPDSYDCWISRDVYAFDLSDNALRGARIALSAHALSVEAIKKMCENWLVCDSLLADDNLFPAFDVVVGNPPWGKVKLSLHSFVNKVSNNYHIYGSQYDDFDQDRFRAEKQRTLEYGKALKERYSLLGNSEPDMYMAFLQRAICVLKPGGYLSYIVPAGLIRSLGTEQLRHFLLRNSTKLKYCLLDNKANFFEIDTRFKFVIVSLKKAQENISICDKFAFEIYKGNQSGVTGTEEIWFEAEELARIRPDLTVPECRSIAEKELFVRIYDHGKEWKKTWSADIAREVDMTNDQSQFHEQKTATDIPVIEGRMIQQFRFGAKAYVSGRGRSAKWIPNTGSVKAQYFISPETISKQLFKRIMTPRVGYCDIAGQTNERAMMSAVIPAGVVCGNKVPTIVFSGTESEKQLYFFVGVTNSFVFDWILRRVLSTTVNYFLLFSLPLPNIDLSDKLAVRIIAITKELTEMGTEYYTDERMGYLRAELDVIVAKAYGLSISDLELIMQDFPLLDRRQPVIGNELRSTYTRDLFLSVAEKILGCKEETYSLRAKAGSKKEARAYIPTEMIELSEGGTR